MEGTIVSVGNQDKQYSLFLIMDKVSMPGQVGSPDKFNLAKTLVVNRDVYIAVQVEYVEEEITYKILTGSVVMLNPEMIAKIVEPFYILQGNRIK